MFKVPDLRNKILFTFVMVTIYRMGSWVPLPGHRLHAAAVAGERVRPRGRARLPQPVLRGGPHPLRGVRARHHAVHHERDHHPAARRGGAQVRAVAGRGGGRPEEADPDDPLPHHRPGPHAGDRPGLRLPQRRRRLPRRRQRAQHRPDPQVHRAPRAADRADHDGGHRVRDVAR